MKEKKIGISKYHYSSICFCRREEREEHVKERVDVGLRVLRSEEGVYEGSEDSEMRVHKVNVKERREGCGQ